jgi:hypothetical protein
MGNGTEGIKMKQTTGDSKDKLNRKIRETYTQSRARVAYKTREWSKPYQKKIHSHLYKSIGH